MVWLDERGRLWGRINVVDLLIVIILGAVLVRLVFPAVAARLAGPGITPPGPAEEVPLSVDFLLTGVRQPTVDAVRVGDQVMETKTNLPLGKITKIRVTPASQAVPTAEGKLVRADLPDQFDLWVTIEGPGRVSTNSIEIATRQIHIGTPLGFRTRLYSVGGTVMGITFKQTGEKQ